MDTVTRDKGDAFSDMGGRIARNSPEVSAAYVILPPNAEPIAALILDTENDLLAFWTSVKTLAEVQINKAIDQDRQRTAGWGGGVR